MLVSYYDINRNVPLRFLVVHRTFFRNLIIGFLYVVVSRTRFRNSIIRVQRVFCLRHNYVVSPNSQIFRKTTAPHSNGNVSTAETGSVEQTVTISTRLNGTLWLTGLSGAGKSTIAQLLFERLRQDDLLVNVLDGDDLRNGLNSDLGFSTRDRAENIRRLGEVALLFAGAGHLSIVSAISPFATDRALVRRRHESSGIAFTEIYVATPLHVCETRDPKGHYAKARRGEIRFFTGVSHPYEVPNAPELTVHTLKSPSESALEVLAFLHDRSLESPNLVASGD
jgi:adenylyl-sulfate kinase